MIYLFTIKGDYIHDGCFYYNTKNMLFEKVTCGVIYNIYPNYMFIYNRLELTNIPYNGSKIISPPLDIDILKLLEEHKTYVTLEKLCK
jgi:hypothetical protein